MSNDVIGEKQLNVWQGEFGQAYIERNNITPERISQRVSAFAEMLAPLRSDPPTSILEVGSNIGLNLRALAQVTTAELMAVEPNETALEILKQDGVVKPENGRAGYGGALPFETGEADMAFTSTVMIHIPDEALAKTMEEMHRVARRYILCVEYFSPKSETISYRGHDDLLFKRDYGGIWMDSFPDLRLLGNGFFWRRTTGLDDVNWWLFEKR